MLSKREMMIKKALFLIMLPALALLSGGCSGVIDSATREMTDNLSYAIVNNNDPVLVADGAPAYLLMVDSLLYKDPENASLLRSAADLYTAYADVFVKDKERALKMTDKSLAYAFQAMCLGESHACSLREISFQEFEEVVSSMDEDELSSLYTLGAAWATWIQVHREDMNAVAQLSRVETIMRRVLALDETYKDGSAHLYLGVLATLLPPALGGKPEVGRAHFQRALEICQGKNFMVYVMYASKYARLIFDRELHDRLLTEILEKDPEEPGYTLLNTLARIRAAELLESADDYF